MRNHALGVVSVVVTLMAGTIVAIAVTGGGHAAAPAPARTAALPAAPRRRSTRPTAAGWETIKAAAHVRRLALGPHRTAHYRAFAAYMGLSGLVGLAPILPGRCAVAVRYLYDNLLDLLHAYTGEDWAPLRRAVATEPSLRSCAPRPALQYVG
jgi:hypothetical protein